MTDFMLGYIMGIASLSGAFIVWAFVMVGSRDE